jgi:MYXO-CTERM domain-containing protein
MPFPAGFTDLQSWTRDALLDPDWLRIGTDIVGGNPAPTFNAAFELTGEAVAAAPEPGSLMLAGAGLLAVWWYRRRRNK